MGVEHNSDEEEKSEAKALACAITRKKMDQFHAYLYLDNCDRTRYGSVVSHLKEELLLKKDKYPKTLLDAHNVIENHELDPEYKKRRKEKQEQKNKSKHDKDSKQDKETPVLTFAWHS